MKKYVIEKDNFKGFVITSLNNEGRSHYTDKTIKEMQQEYESELITITDEELNLVIKEYENSLQNDWQEISEEDYYDMLECLPPMNWRTITPGVNVFCISEGYYGSLHSHYLKLSNKEGVKYYSALRCIYTTTNEQILQQIKNIK